MSREWKFYIADMITFSQNVLDYTADFNQVEFEANRLVYDATLRNLELIGEAATLNIGVILVRVIIWDKWI